MDQSKPPPHLYLVATPIGNLKDITLRAIDTLKRVDWIYCEDTRVTVRLLQAYQIDKPLRMYHEHNAEAVRPGMLQAMARGERIALVSDAGTPLISDPGYKLVQAAYAQGLIVSAIPGACAATAGVSVSGLPTDRFKFCGFLPPKSSARQTALLSQKDESCTLVYYESAKRLVACLEDVQAALGNRAVAVARELTKTFEEVQRGSCQEVGQWYQAHSPRGEVVLCIAGAVSESVLSDAWKAVIAGLAPQYSAKDLCALMGQVSPYSKSQVYAYAVACQQNKL